MIDSNMEPRGNDLGIRIAAQNLQSLVDVVHLDQKGSMDQLRVLGCSVLGGELLESATARFALIGEEQDEDLEMKE